MTEHKPTPPTGDGRCLPTLHPHMPRCWEAGWQAGFTDASTDAEGVDEWAVETPVFNGASWGPEVEIKTGFESYEHAADYAVGIVGAIIGHRRVSAWRAVEHTPEPDPVVPEVQEGSL